MLINDVIQSIKDYCRGTVDGKRIADDTSRDRVLYGDPNKECTGIVTSIYASPEVIQRAQKLNANLIICHEALLWNHGDHRDWLEESQNKTYLDKKKLLDDYGIVVWRFHDYIHSGIPLEEGWVDGIFYGVAHELGWETAQVRKDGRYEAALYMECEETSAREIGTHIMKTFNLRGLKCIGNLDAKVRKILLCGHVMEGGNSDDLIKKIDEQDINLLLPLELIDFTLTEYVKDSAQLGYDRCIIAPGHFNIEEPGMKYMEEWINKALPEKIPCHYVQAGDMYCFM